ncbi:MAG: hypothetical protein JW830_09480 [Bacteroidales bacterium]|nr:hypothetical protein [Bacteroidales bacterium]
MTNRISILLLFLILLKYSTTISGQEAVVFSGETGKYPDELSLYIQKNINAESESVLNEFLTAWRGDSIFNAREQEKIVKTSRDLLKKNAKPYPHFAHYLKCIVLMKKTGQKPENFSNWEKGLDVLLSNPKASLLTTDRYLVFTRHLIDSSSLYRSRTVDWRSASRDYRIAVDTAIRFIFKKTNLLCYVRTDSIQISETSGEFNPVTSVWKGTGGLVTWERAGFKQSEVYVQLNSYEINMTRSEYNARDAVFVNKFYFDSPLKGIMTDKVQLIKTPEDADYPRFDSYQKDFKIKELYKDIDFEGGLSMQGSKLVGTGNRDRQAQVFIYRKDTLVLIASSDYFAFKSNRINAPTAGIVIKLKKDSIFHPGLAFSFMVPSRELSLYRTDNFMSQSPYFNSYHNIDMTFEQLVWKMNEPVMRFTALLGSQIGNANFESVNFFNNEHYLSMQLMDDVHPLVSIRSFARFMNVEEFLADDFARYLKKPVAQVKQLLMRMASQGFLFYDSETGLATIRPRLHDYLASSVARIDYDVISIPSRTNSPVENAVFDLRNYDLTINGIPRIFVSDSQNVVIFPENDRIIMKKNRHFQFDGQIQGGLFTFYGKNFFFNYDTFKIELQKIDSLRIRYLTEQVDNYGFPVAEKALNLIQDIKGELYIDKPDNKSGRKSYPEYPYFRSTESGFVYYDEKKTQNGVYSRDRFYFEIYPFDMDSLDNFNRRSMRFEGQLTSAGIFPVIEETLRLQPDKSLGFIHSTADSALSLFGGKGSFTNDIKLSNKGLQGSGKVNYLTSSNVSEDIDFYPDSLNAFVRDFTILKKTSETQFPQVNSMNNKIHWLPYDDEFYVYRTDSSFRMFENSTLLAGNLKLQPSGLSGNGRMILEGAELNSNLFTYRATEIDADTTDFYLKSLHTDGFTVLTENMKSHIDFSESKGIFTSNEDFTLVSFPENKYVSYLDNFEWDMEKKELAMGSRFAVPPATEVAEEGLRGPRYISIDPSQDSLSFIAPLAFYDYDSNLIKATAVKYIDIADARIYPENEKLTVQPDARLRPLYKAKVMANRTSRYYDLFDATLTITGRNKYTGTAYYNYTDELGQKQLIYFSSLGVDNRIQTIGSGDIAETDEFTLSPNYRYQGKFYMEAASAFLTFDGGALIEHNCENISPHWVNFRSEIDPLNIMIPIREELIDINRDKIFNGMYLYYDSVHVYPAFLSGRKNYSDKAVISSSGFLFYDKPAQQYLIASKEKLMDRDMPGNLLKLHRESCELYGEGKMDPGAKLGQLKLTTVGNLLHKSVTNETEMDVILGVDFYIADNIIDVMASEADSMTNLPAVDLNRPFYAKGIVELIGKSRYDAMKSELSLFGSLKEMPPELKHTLVFNELKLKWNNESNSWVSVGKIGIASINNSQVNKRVDGLIELQIKRSGDILDIYLQFDRRTWYYFGYTRGVMQIHSSNGEFLDRMKKLKPNERRLKVTTGESYIYMVSTDVKKNTFVRRYRDLTEQQEQ